MNEPAGQAPPTNVGPDMSHEVSGGPQDVGAHLSSGGMGAVVASLAEAVVVIGPDGCLRAWNAAAERSLGLGTADQGRPWRELVDEDAVGSVLDLAPTVPGAPPADVGGQWTGPLGLPVDVRAQAFAVAVEGGVGHVLVVQDLSERLQMQDAMAELHRRMQETQTLAHVGLWVWDRAADNLQWTDELFRIHRLDPLAFDGTLEAHLAPIPAADREAVRQSLESVAQGREEDTAITYPIDTPDGRRWVALRARATTRDDRVVGLVGTCQDVTERARYESAIEMANSELERFARSVAHDLKSPLTIMIGMADLIAMKVEPEEGSELELLVEKMRTSGHYAADMVRDLMNSAQLRAREGTFSPVNLEEVMGSVRRGLMPQLTKVGAELKVGKLPVVDGARALLAQVVRNLVGNALKYRHPDRRLRIEVAGGVVGDGWELRIADNGRGIPVGQRHVVFDAGVRLHADHGIEGDGHGLATVRSIVEQHGGRIHVEDGIDGGAAFVVWLPRHDRAVPDRDEGATEDGRS